MNIEQMILEASGGISKDTLSGDGVRRFAALVAEECAKICDLETGEHSELSIEFAHDAARLCARNVRDAFRQ